ncbi:peptide/nickel transport system ATP-binding protein [Rhodococcus wratislaviensis]|uniref:ABC transporter ATP-binding protein n=1 Tax=Rhodococcus wratislaviensis TaxID=44752 RepID=A0AB38F7Z4_RHOWR|nr:ABC transporter ATP-binding protein [Rhodococcus wratislaviensis]REE76496.1 peptide/nickel transport system ATP-binding protein [Rhodococcus wratislaviensis]SPZ36290.1 ABC transporter ATP-binding protein [Rhodococcus wratislaviensis]
MTAVAEAAATSSAGRRGNGPLIVARSLHIEYASEASHLPAVQVVDDVSFQLERGQTLAVVGQSGSGKTTIARAAIGLLPSHGRISSGSVHILGRDVTRYEQKQWRDLRGGTIGYVPQDPLGSLDPLQRVGDQVAETLLVHGRATRRDVRSKVTRLLDRVGIRNPAERARSYPHQLSGGQLQRVLIAIAIAVEPAVLVADEPTSALDVTVQKRILDLLADLQDELGLGILFITHDLALVREHSDSVLVLNEGRVREAGPASEVLDHPTDPYTVTLMSDAPALSPGKYAHRRAVADLSATPLLEVRNLTKTFATGRRGKGQASTVAALDSVSFSVARGSTHALVGESGSGKTTTARIIAGLSTFDSGEVFVDGRPLKTDPRSYRQNARLLQTVQQNPLAAMDPRYTIADVIEEPLRIVGSGDRASRHSAVRDVLDRVALPSDVLGRRPLEISGGQRQRVVLARALVLAPQILVLDEPTSALDVTVQAQIVDLLVDLQTQLGLTYLFISHDLSLVRQISDTVTVLEHGRLVESGSITEVFGNPADPYTARLIDAVPGRIPLTV